MLQKAIQKYNQRHTAKKQKFVFNLKVHTIKGKDILRLDCIFRNCHNSNGYGGSVLLEVFFKQINVSFFVI